MDVTRDDREIVADIRQALVQEVGEQRYQLWFADTTHLSLREGSLVITVGSTFAQGFLRRDFSADVRQACIRACGRPLPLAFEVDAALGAAPQPPAEQNAPAAAPAAQPTAAASSKPAPYGSRRFSNFASLVIGPCNQLAAASARSLAEQAAPYSSLLVHGPTGVGKTHVLEAMWSMARQNGCGRCVYLTAEQFTTYFLAALRGAGVPSFRSKYRGIDLLLIDDLQFFAGKKSTLGELFHTVDELLRLGRRVVFAADRSPAELHALGPELVTRVSGGMVARIEPPDEATRLEIVRQHAARLGIARVTVEPDSTLLLDATVVIGADWFPVPPAAPIQHWK
ncbi:MAG: DnaA/Hda family protein, partial [Pirellulales bacterium]